MFAALSKATFSGLAGSSTLRKLATRYGMRQPHSFARRFVAGESVEEAIAVSRALEARGLLVSLDYLGEHARTRDAAAEATRAYVVVARAVAEAGISRNLSLKLTQLGLEIDRATAVDNLRRILDGISTLDFFVRVDMEDSAHTEETIDTFESLWNIGWQNIGIVIQAYLRKSTEYVQRMNRLGARVRLVKGAYREPSKVAFQEKTEVDAKFIDLMQLLLKDGVYPAIATHDLEMIDATRQFAAAQRVPKGKFEFQMLYGVRRDLQASIAAEGYPFRVYVPFGQQWFPYFMRRLGERPANVGFVLKSLMREDRTG